MKNPFFYSKIMLFGEYGLINNSMGLTIPLNFYQGALSLINKDSFESNNAIKKYLNFLKKNLKDQINIELFEKDIKNGLYFHSNIPEGYGVGSSGALVAAIYDRYSLNKIEIDKNITNKKILILKKIFSKMESYFHGKSSGIDPLICYLNIPLLIESNDKISKIGLPICKDEGVVFIINSGKPGKTKSMINIFFNKMREKHFRNTLKKHFIKYNNECIHFFLKGEYSELFKSLKNLSLWVLENFNQMIPENMVKIWIKGIKTNTYYLKLCGSGGGGYILGFTKDYKNTKKYLKNLDIKVVYKF